MQIPQVRIDREFQLGQRVKWFGQRTDEHAAREHTGKLVTFIGSGLALLSCDGYQVYVPIAELTEAS